MSSYAESLGTFFRVSCGAQEEQDDPPPFCDYNFTSASHTFHSHSALVAHLTDSTKQARFCYLFYGRKLLVLTEHMIDNLSQSM